MKKQCSKCTNYNQHDGYCLLHGFTVVDNDKICEYFKPMFQVKQLEFNSFNAAHTNVGVFRLLDNIWYQGDFRYEFSYFIGETVETRLFAGFKTLQDTKEAAQTHFEKLIMECIE